MLIAFSVVLSLILTVLASTSVLIKFISFLNYSELDKEIDNYKGIKKNYNSVKELYIFIICGSWLITVFFFN